MNEREQEIKDALHTTDSIRLNITNIINDIEETIRRLNISPDPLQWPSSLNLPEDLENIDFIGFEQERDNIVVSIFTNDSTKGQYTIPIDLYLEFDNNFMVVNDEDIDIFYNKENKDTFTLKNVFD